MILEGFFKKITLRNSQEIFDKKPALKIYGIKLQISKFSMQHIHEVLEDKLPLIHQFDSFVFVNDEKSRL